MLPNSFEQWTDNCHYLLTGKFTRMLMDDLSLRINNKGKGNRIKFIAQLLSQGNAGNAAD
jgi:hypothetical protein